MRRKPPVEPRLMSLHGAGNADSMTGQALMLGEIEQRLRALGWGLEHDRRYFARRHTARSRSIAVGGAEAGMHEGAQVPGAIRTSWGRLVDLKSGQALTAAELKLRFEEAGFDEKQVCA